MSSTDTTAFYPDRRRYLMRVFIDAFVGALVFNTLGFGFMLIPAIKEGWNLGIFCAIGAGVNGLYWLIMGLYLPAFVARISYEMTDEEIVVRKGVLNRIHKIVPYRTVTNVEIRRGWLDRIWLGLGNVHIQTAGAGAQNVAEERLMGLANFGEIRDALIAHLRRYRADTSPALGGGRAGAREPAAEPTGKVAEEMLAELRAIRELLEEGAA